MKALLSSLKKSSFIKSIFIVISGTALAQIITFALMPIVTRLYGPESMGILGSYIAIGAILGPIAAFTYPIAIVLPKKDTEARAIVKLSIGITTIVSIVLFMILLLASDDIVKILKLEFLSNFILLIPLYLFVTGISQVMEQWLIRSKSYKITARTAVSQSIFMNGSKVVGGLIYPFSLTLVIIQTIGIFFRSFMMFIMSDKSIIKKNEKHKIEDLKKVAIDNIDFPLYRTPQVLINAISQGLPVLLFSMFLGPVIAGYYSLGKQALNTPIQLVGKAVQDVFYPKINELAKNNKSITPKIIKAILGLFAIGILPFGLIIIFGPGIFSLVFGNQWYVAGEYARWISLVSLAILITRPIIVTIPVVNIQKQFLIIEVIGTIFKTLSLVIGIFVIKKAIFAVALFSIASVLMYVFLMAYTLFVSMKYDKLNID